MNIEWLSFWLGASALLAAEVALLVLSVVLSVRETRKAQQLVRTMQDEDDGDWVISWPKPQPPHTKETRN